MNMKCLVLVSAVILGLAIAIGSSVAGFFIGKGFYMGRMTDRFVTVKGLAEKNVVADLAIWNINYIASGDDITVVNNAIQHDQELALAFAKQQGFSENEIEHQGNQVVYQQPITTQGSPTGPRYLLNGGITIRSTQVVRVQRASQMTDQLIKQGVVLGSSFGVSTNPIYFYTQLNTVRPAMLAEATQSARDVALQFAKDSHSRLGSIRRANQGVFVITSRDSPGMNPNDWQAVQDEKNAINKKIRLVTTLDYLLLPENEEARVTH